MPKLATPGAIRLLLLSLVITLLLSSIVLSLGIRPAKVELESEKYPEYSGEFWVVNNDRQGLTVKVFADGELGKYIIIHEPYLTFMPDDEAKAVHYEIVLPPQVPPGTSIGVIVVEQTISSAISSGIPLLPGSGNVERQLPSPQSAIGTKMIIKYKILVQGPYPDKFIIPRLNFNEDDHNIRLSSELENKGKKDIAAVQTTFYINDEQNPYRLQSGQTSIKSGENTVLTAVIPKTSLDDGEYEVLAVTTFDDNKVEIQKKMIVGEPEIDITYFNSILKANSINLLTIELLNKWNKLLENVFIDVAVKKEGAIQDTFRTKSITLPALMRTKILEYYDARSKTQGIYTFDLKVNYWNTYAQKEQTFTVEFVDPVEPVVSSPATGSATAAIDLASPPSPESSRSSLLLVLIGITILLVSIVGSYIIYRYRHRDEYEDDI